MTLNFGTIECYPDCFCEPHAGAGILFWSSGAYFLSASLLYFRTPRKTLEFEFWVFCNITLAISSFLFHATQTRTTLALDYASIVMTLIFFPLWTQMGKLSRRKKETIFYIVYISSWILFLQLGQVMRIGFSIVVFIISLIAVRQEAVRFRSHGYLQAAVVLSVLSFFLFLLEETRWACDKASFFQAHALWHMGSATALYLYGRWRFSHHSLR